MISLKSSTCFSVIASLWCQKVKHWTNFLVLKASQAIFHHNKDAIVQLLRSCFTTALGLNTSSASITGVGALLGHGFGSQFSGDISTVTPGIVYIRAHSTFGNVMLITEEIVSLLMQSVKDISNGGLTLDKVENLKKKRHDMKCGHVSLAAATSQVKTAASLAASLVWITGGLNSLQSLFIEILPSWFISTRALDPDKDQESRGMFAMLSGYALAHFIVLCGLFAWGEDSASPAAYISRPKVLGWHFEFLASALEGRISLGCSKATWRAYATGYLSLMISCCSKWMLDVDVEVVKRVSKVLKQWNEEEMAMALLGISGFGAMGVAAEMIIENSF